MEVMRTVYQGGAAIFVTLALAACASTAVEPQTKSRDQRHARIYFLRPQSALGPVNSDEIAVNGQKVGIVAPGSHLFVDRPPGRYLLGLRGGLATWKEYQPNIEVQVAAGGSYYFEVGPPLPRMNIELMNSPLMGITGQPTSGCVRDGFLCFYSLEPSAGSAKAAD